MLGNNKVLSMSLFAVAAAVVGGVAWLSDTAPAHAAVPKATQVQVLQQVGYAGQLDKSLNGQFPVVFRFFKAGDQLAYEETVIATLKGGQLQVNIGKAQDLRGVLKDATQMKVFLNGTLVDTVTVLHASKDDVLANPGQYAAAHTVTLTEEATQAAAVPNAPLAGLCFILNTGFFNIPFTFTTVGVGTPSCGAAVAVSGGYSFLTLPSQGVNVFGLFPPAQTNWQVNYQVAGTSATVQTTTLCCP